jgi:hypothetical protein
MDKKATLYLCLIYCVKLCQNSKYKCSSEALSGAEINDIVYV